MKNVNKIKILKESALNDIKRKRLEEKKRNEIFYGHLMSSYPFNNADDTTNIKLDSSDNKNNGSFSNKNNLGYPDYSEIRKEKILEQMFNILNVFSGVEYETVIAYIYLYKLCDKKNKSYIDKYQEPSETIDIINLTLFIMYSAIDYELFKNEELKIVATNNSIVIPLLLSAKFEIGDYFPILLKFERKSDKKSALLNFKREYKNYNFEAFEQLSAVNNLLDKIMGHSKSELIDYVTNGKLSYNFSKAYYGLGTHISFSEYNNYNKDYRNKFSLNFSTDE